MAVVAEELISDLIVRDGKLRSGIRSAQQAYGAGIGSMRNDTKRFESEFNRSTANISTGFKQLAGTLAAGVSLAATSQLIDSFTRLQNSLRVAGLEGKNLEAVQTDLLNLSTRYGVGIEGLANLYGKATDAGKSFGASQAQILQLTEATSQSLLITGTRAEQASGAILGLSQALASGTVRAEEFNQINEGGLRPLLQAAAATERFGGDINKLRAAVLEGKLSSQEFFNAIMEGSAQLEGQASKATLTLSGAFEALNSALTVYVGTAASTSGVTGALAAGIGALAENLDTIIPAISTIAALIGVRYVAGLVGATVASVGLRVASLGLAVSLNGVRAAATGAGAALLAAMGGPVSAAIIVLVATLALAASRADQLSQASDHLKQSHAAVASGSDAAAKAIDKLAASYGKARAEARLLAEEQLKLSGARLALAERDVLIAEKQATRAKTNTGRYSGAIDQSTAADVAIAQQNVISERQTNAKLRAALAAPPSSPAASAAAAGTTKGRTGGRSSGADPVEQAAQRAYQEQQDMRALFIEELRAKEELAATAKERAEFQRQTLELERAGRLAEINEAVRRKDLTAQEGEARRRIIENLYGAGDEIKVQSRESAYEERITREEKRDIERDRADVAQTELDNRRDELQFALDMADTNAERRRIALQILEAETETRRLALEGIIATEAVNSAKRKQAEAELATLDARAGRDAQRIGRDTESPLDRYGRESTKTAEQIKEDIESIQVQGLEALGDGITDVIMQTRSLGDVFKSVANQIIADLIRIAVQKAIIGPLTNAIGGGGGGLASLFGGGNPLGSGGGMDLRGFRAGGGPVRAGQLYRVNEGQQEFFRPATDGRVVPLSQQAQAARPAASAMQGPTIVQLAVAPGEMFVPIVEGISGNVAVRTVQATAPGLVRAATNQTLRQAGRPRT